MRSIKRLFLIPVVAFIVAACSGESQDPVSGPVAPVAAPPVQPQVGELDVELHPTYPTVLAQVEAVGYDRAWLKSRARIEVTERGNALVVDADMQAIEADLGALAKAGNLNLPAVPLPDGLESPKAEGKGCSTTDTYCPGFGGNPPLPGLTYRSNSPGYGTSPCRYTPTNSQAPSYYYNSAPPGTAPCNHCCPSIGCPAYDISFGGHAFCQNI